MGLPEKTNHLSIVRRCRISDWSDVDDELHGWTWSCLSSIKVESQTRRMWTVRSSMEDGLVDRAPGSSIWPSQLWAMEFPVGSDVICRPPASGVGLRASRSWAISCRIEIPPFRHPPVREIDPRAREEVDFPGASFVRWCESVDQ